MKINVELVFKDGEIPYGLISEAVRMGVEQQGFLDAGEDFPAETKISLEKHGEVNGEFACTAEVEIPPQDWKGDASNEAKEDIINHPHHYRGKTLEAIDVIEDFGLSYHMGNAIKYLLRADKKGSRIENLRKARWYINRMIEGKK